MNQSKTVAIVGGGRLSKQFIAEIVKSDYVIGVDRGAYWLIVNKITPDIAIGDFDSVSLRELKEIKKRVKTIKKYPPEKDATDMELAALHAITLQPKEVIMYGAIGTRLDHSIGNVQLLERLHGMGILRDRNNEVRIISGRTTVKKDARYHYVSLLPITETLEVTLSGFFYDVTRAFILRGQTLGVSNEIRGHEATIEVHQGKALVVRSRD